MDNAIIFEVAERLFDFGSGICSQARITAYLQIAQVNETQSQVLTEIGGWMNQELAISSDKIKTSKAPMIARWKVGSLVAALNWSVPIHRTPTGIELGCGWKGGVKKRFGPTMWILGVSGLDENIDELFGAALLHAIPRDKIKLLEVRMKPGGDLVEVVVDGPESKLFMNDLWDFLPEPRDSGKRGKLVGVEAAEKHAIPRFLSIHV